MITPSRPEAAAELDKLIEQNLKAGDWVDLSTPLERIIIPDDVEISDEDE